MAHNKIGSGNWILVCDGGKALILRNDGTADKLHFTTQNELEVQNPRSSEQGTDRPGRIYNSYAVRRSSAEMSDYHEAKEREFLKSISVLADETIRNQECPRLFVVAPPKVLGILRDDFSRAVKSAIVEEIAKDLVRLPINQIEDHLAS